MAIKDLFTKKSNKLLSSKDLSKTSIDIEGPEYLKEVSHKKRRTLPNTDYSKPQNFARFGSAKKYYEDAFNYIQLRYPFDGSKKEKLQWEASASAVDLYVFENLYPRTTGYATFLYDSVGQNATYNGKQYASASSPSYLTLFGTLNTGSSMAVLSTGFDSSNVYKPAHTQSANLQMNFDKGVTVEFWAEQGTVVPSSASVIFDLWNNVTTGTFATPREDYGRLTIEITGSSSGSFNFLLTAQSGTTGIFQQEIGASLTDYSNWNHYAFRFYNVSNDLKCDLYVNGSENDSYVASSNSLQEVTGALVATIGAFKTAPSGSTALSEGWGGYSGSLDEFRYWKEKRTDSDIKRFYFTNVNGGANTDKYKTEIGVYYKFNEGITNRDAIDSIVLDYSGRTTNATWVNYSTVGQRNTGSAIVSASVADSEFLDPIIYSVHPLVSSEKSRLMTLGENYDINNDKSVFNMYPNFMQDAEDQLANFSQIIGSYFDEAYLFTEFLPKLKFKEYVSGSNKPHRFFKYGIMGQGMVAPEIFEQVDELAELYNRDELIEFKDQLENVKNIIYQNVYVNLVDIYKMKGTEEAYRNLIRCFGIDDELIKINRYANNEEFKYRTNVTSRAVAKKYFDCSTVDKFDGTIYQYSSPHRPESVSYISGTITEKKEEKWPITVEASVFFPKKPSIRDKNYNNFYFPNVTASLFGCHPARTGSTTDLTFATSSTWSTSSFQADFQVYAVKDYVDSDDVKFVLRSTVEDSPFPTLTSSLFQDVYDNNEWNISVRVSPQEKNAGIVPEPSQNSYLVEFYGVNSIVDEVQNSFYVTGTMEYESGSVFLTSPKRLYLGTHRTNFTGSALNRTDVKFGYLRYWFNRLEDEALIAHSKDPELYGDLYALRKRYENINGIETKNIPEIDTLALNWEFYNVTGSDASGQTYIDDYTSGSAEKTGLYGFIGGIVNNQHTGRADYLLQSSTSIVDKQYVAAAKQNLPELVHSSDMIDILVQDDERFTSDTRPVNYFLSFEKNMYQNISEEMLNWFGTITEFNNLIGEPIHRYQQEYRGLRNLRQLFFEKVGNSPDFDRFVEFYRWFDTSLGQMLMDLVPASSEVKYGIDNVLENHLFARDKYYNKYPTVEKNAPEPNTAANTINKLKVNYIYNSPPRTDKNETSFEWLKYDASRSGSFLTSGDTGTDQSAEGLRKVYSSDRNRKFGTPLSLNIDLDEY